MSGPHDRTRSGSLVVVLLSGLATLIAMADGILHPQRRYLALMIACLGLVATWRRYVDWRRSRVRESRR